MINLNNPELREKLKDAKPKKVVIEFEEVTLTYVDKNAEFFCAHYVNGFGLAALSNIPCPVPEEIKNGILGFEDKKEKEWIN